MKTVIFSDLHIFAHLSRTQFEDIAQDFLIYLLSYCKTNNIERVYFLGDWFHIKNKLYVPPFIKSIEILRSFRDQNIKLSFLIGNHDAPQMNSTDHSIMFAFKEFGQVVSAYDWIDEQDARFHFLSFSNELPEFEMAENKKNVLFGHLDIKNFFMESGFACQEGFDSESFNKFDNVFSGHFHKHQVSKNIVYVGSPYQTRFSERNDDKGFIVLETDDMSWEFVTYNKAPRFIEVVDDINSAKAEDIKGNFVRFKTHKSNDNLSEIKNNLLLLGAETVDFIFEDENEEKEFNMIEDMSTGTMSELASSYFDNIKESDLFPKSIKILMNENELDKSNFMKIFNDIEEAHLSGWKPEDE